MASRRKEYSLRIFNTIKGEYIYSGKELSLAKVQEKISFVSGEKPIIAEIGLDIVSLTLRGKFMFFEIEIM